MTEKIKTFFANLKLENKLRLCFIPLSAALLFCMVLGTYQHYYNNTIQSEQEKVAQAMDRARDSLNTTFSSFSMNTAKMLLNNDIKNSIYLLQTNQSASFAAAYQKTSDRLGTYVSNLDMLDSAYLVSKNFSYGSSNTGFDANPFDLFNNDLFHVDHMVIFSDGLTWKSATADIITAVFPVTYSNSSNGIQILYGMAPESENQVYLVSLLKEQVINAILTQHSTTLTDDFFLMTEDGLRITSLGRQQNARLSNKVQKFILENGECLNEPLDVGDDLLYLSARKLNFGGMILIHQFSRKGLQESSAQTRMFLAALWLGSVVVFWISASFVARFLTRPFDNLRRIIDQINTNTYNEKIIFKYRDESGMLGNQLNRMYDTIQAQIRQIRTEEAQKARAEIQMYSEQINPHFLYNTLECIHFQILNQNNEVAGLMVESLGKYLRVTLNYGKLWVPLSQEVQHVTEYMNIVNRHSTTESIRFSCEYPEELKDLLVMKRILQPLTENAVKHGFSREFSSYMLPPEIRITMTRQGAFLVVEVVDNGDGIDIPYTQRCMTDASFEGGKHFAMRNIYQRLRTVYSEAVEISFESVPYYRNAVILHIPMKELLRSHPHDTDTL